MLCLGEAVNSCQAVALNVQLLQRWQMLYAFQAGQLVVVTIQVCQQPAAGDAFYAG
jgi:hypothetical protein